VNEHTFPFPAWDLRLHQPLVIVGWHRYSRCYEDADGYAVLMSDVTDTLPAWLAEAERRLADARDEAETLDDVRHGGAM